MKIDFGTRVFPFISWRQRAYGISILLAVILAVATVAQGGINLGIDFVGGTSVIVKFDQPVTPELLAKMREWLEPRGLGGSIRTIGATGGAMKEAQEISIDIRGSEWVDEMAGRWGQGSFEDFQGHFQPEMRTKFLAYFTGDSEAPALYDPATITSNDLRNLLQTIFNENIAKSVQDIFSENLPPNEEKKQFDINHMANATRLASVLAEIKRAELEATIAGMMSAGDTALGSARPWKSVEEFIAITGLSQWDNVDVRRGLNDSPDSANLTGSVSVLSGSARDLSSAFLPAITERFLRNSRLVIAARDEVNGGLFSSISQATALVPADDIEMKSLLERSFHAGRFVIIQSETVGASIGEDTSKNALWAVIASMIGITLYIWLRFELRFSIGAIVALVHDTILTILMIGALGWEFNIPIIAAILTVMGYSVNDTIVVYDRIREKLGKLKGPPDPAIIDMAITETLSRTILTGGSTILSIIAFMILGPLVTRDMSGALAFGVIIGTFSSIFVASPVLIEWDKFAGAWLNRIRARKGDGRSSR